LNTPDYVNKGINDIIVDYFHYLNLDKQKTITNLAISIGILIGSDVIKSIVQNLIRDNAKTINDTLISTIKLISFDNIYNIGRGIWNYTIDTKNAMFLLFRKKPTLIYVRDDYEPKMYSIDLNFSTDDIFIKNLIQLMENYHSQKANVYQNISNISFNETLSNEITINNSHTNLEKRLSNINIQYDDLVIDINSLTYDHSSNKEIVVKQNEISKNPLLDILLKEFKGFEYIYELCYEHSKFEVTIGDTKNKYYLRIYSYSVSPNSNYYFTSNLIYPKIFTIISI